MHTRRAKAQRGLAETWGWLLLTLLVAPPSTWGQAVPSGQAIPLVVRTGRCECVLPTSNPHDKIFLILGSVSKEPGPYPVTVQTEATDAAPQVPQENPSADKGLTEGILLGRGVPAGFPREAISEREYPPADEPPRMRKFFLFVKEHDFYNPENYVTVSGELQGVGRHCQVYIDRDYDERSRLQPTVDDIVRTFDNEVYPRACRSLGQAADVDRDGRFTILLTPWLGRLSNGKASLGGFVRGSDFFRDLAPPYGNRCDMMYLNTDLAPGTTLRTILAHEYTHAVIFSEHMFGSYQPQAPRQDEEGWLNEGLAHLVEDLHGYSWNNLDYRISAFLSAPERYQLTVADYFQAGLFRSHGHRGAAYLFLRWCCDRCGDDVLKQLVQTNLIGTANVEAAMHERFADLFRQWTIALALSGTNLAEERTALIRRVNLHEPLAGRLLCGPRFQEMILAGDKYEACLAGTSAAFVLLHSPAKTGTRLSVIAEPESHLQITLVRLPDRTGRLSLRLEPQDSRPARSGSQTLRLQVTAHDQDLLLEHAAWERLVPTANRPEDTSYRPADVDPSGNHTMLQTWFGDLHLKAGETRTSEPISFPSRGASEKSWVFKISATDTAGHHLSAWAVK